MERDGRGEQGNRLEQGDRLQQGDRLARPMTRRTALLGAAGAGCVLAGMFTTQALQARPVPGPTLEPPSGKRSLDYDVFLDNYRGGFEIARLHQDFEAADGHYRLHAEARAKGVFGLLYRGTLIQTSQGRLGPEGFAPERYEERRGNRPATGATIDAPAGTARLFDGRTLQAQVGTQDRLSVLAQIGLLLAAGAAGQPKPDGRIVLPLLGASTIEPSNWRIEPDETLDFGGRSLRCLHVKRILAAGDNSASTEVWYDRRRLPWPVRMRVGQSDGRALDEVLVDAGTNPA